MSGASRTRQLPSGSVESVDRAGWSCQVDALVTKNLELLWSRKVPSILIVAIPSVFVVLVAVLQHVVQVNHAPDNPLEGDLAVVEVGGAILTIGAMLSTIIQVNLLCSEKQRGLTSYARMVGMQESAYWVANYCMFAATSAVTAVLMVLVGLCTRVDPFTVGNSLVLGLIYAVFFMAQSAMACYVSSFMTRPTVINLFTFFLFGFASASAFVQNLNPFILDTIYAAPHEWSWFSLGVLPLMPWMSFCRVFDELARQTTVFGTPFSWSELTAPGTYYEAGFPNGKATDSDGNINPAFYAPSGLVSLLTLAGALPYFFVLAWWSSQTFGQEFRKRFFFPCTPSYWGCTRGPAAAAAGDQIYEEKLTSGRSGSIRVHKLSKSFKTVSALKEVSLAMEKDRIFTLLGHNGAGKTTLLNTLTGLHDPTFGEAFVCGHSVRTEMPAIQRLMGICPQHDVLWEDLTARQHLRFYARFKGIARDQCDDYVRSAIIQFGLEAEADLRAGTFSGGMKRRLSVAISSMGDPRVCYLDEPST